MQPVRMYHQQGHVFRTGTHRQRVAANTIAKGSYNAHNHIWDFNTSRPFLWQVFMFGAILFLLGGNVYQFKRNMDLSDNDLKYCFIKMYGGASGEASGMLCSVSL